MPPLKSPPAFHEQRRSLERARTEDYLKRKIHSRPARSDLVRMHILEETCAEASLQAKQLMLKKARLADDLNDKLSQRPGPMELIEKNIIPVHSSIRQAILDAAKSSGDDDSGDALSPDHAVSQESTNQTSPPDPALPSASPDAPASEPAPEQAPPPPPPPPLPVPNAAAPQQELTNGTATQKPAAGQLKGSKAVSDRSRKQKDSKPKVRKLKYHQYIPPDQKTEKESLPPLDSTYSKLLHQQQLFLQLQIMSQHHSNYPTILPAPPRPPGEQQASSTSRSSSTKKASPPQPPSTDLNGSSHHAIIEVNLPPLPPNLEELKVAELKHELKIRALTVSGTKNNLIERLKSFHKQHGDSDSSSTPGATSVPVNSNTNTSQPQLQQNQQQQIVQSPASTHVLQPSGNSSMVVAALPLVATVGGGGTPPAVQPQMMQFGSCSSSPPLSPTQSEQSLTEMSPDDHVSNGDTFGEMVTSPLTQLSLQPSSPTLPTVHIIDDSPPVIPLVNCGPTLLPLTKRHPADKDQMLQEKDRRIAELTRMLQQKQQLVERLRSQLHGQHTGGGAIKPHPTIIVKEEPQDIPMEEVEEIQVQQQQQKQNKLEQIILQQKQLTLCKQTQNKHKKTHKEQPSPTLTKQQQQQQLQPVSQQGTKGLINQQSYHLTPFQVDGLKSNSKQSLLMDKNGNHFLPKLINHNMYNQASKNPQNKVTNRVNPQRQKSTPTKLPRQSALEMPDSDVQSIQQTICKQPLKKALKPEKHSSTNHIKARSLLFTTANSTNEHLHSPNHMEEICLDVDQQILFSPPSPKLNSVSPRCRRDEMCLGVDQHILFTPPSPKVNSTPTSRRRKNGRTQKIDNLFDILVQSGEISGNFKPTPDPALSHICTNSPPISPSPSPLHMSPPTLSIPDTSHGVSSVRSPIREAVSNSSIINGRLEDFLESTTGKPLFGVEPGGHVTLIDELHSQLLSTPSILDHPSSPMDTYEFGLTSSRTGLELAESAMDSMDWLDLGIGGSVGDGPSMVGLNGHAPTSVFSTDFLDSSDLHLHWDCL
ncbi:myocardin-related transcription factor A [Hoplias malabaricus]|uniref:myocardin-related transcription factor A n=1 Tax=Hoplias malabaricus TaxID=27720 RepID=UPI00346384E6